MIVLVYLIVLLRELLVSTIFCMVHPYIAIHSFLHLLHIFFALLINVIVSTVYSHDIVHVYMLL